VSGGFWLEGESGLAEESADEAVLSLDAVELVPYRGDQLGHGPCATIRIPHRTGKRGRTLSDTGRADR
jgi:hypothetical protein